VLADPPWFTGGPNPATADWVRPANAAESTPAVPITAPLALDVSAGKNDPIYNDHPYHTKVPYRAIVPYILHFTRLQRRSLARIRTHVFVQIGVDLAVLTVLLHYVGGVTNPLALFYLFHAFIAALVLSIPAAVVKSSSSCALALAGPLATLLRPRRGPIPWPSRRRKRRSCTSSAPRRVTGTTRSSRSRAPRSSS